MRLMNTKIGEDPARPRKHSTELGLIILADGFDSIKGDGMKRGFFHKCVNDEIEVP